MSDRSKEHKYHYKAIVSGQDDLIEGNAFAASPEELHAKLRDANLRPILIVEKKSKLADFLATELGKPKTALSLSEIGLFCQSMSGMLKKGTHLEKALQNLKAIFPVSSNIHLLANHLFVSMRLGRTLADSLKDEKFQFPNDIAFLIQAGESSGNLGQIMDACCEEVARRKHLRQEFVSATAYPALILVVALFAVMALSVFVAPEIRNLFIDIEKKPPVSLDILAGLGGVIVNYYILLFVSISLLLLSLSILYPSAWFKNLRHSLKFKLPVVSHINKLAASIRFASVYRLSKIAGLPDITTATNAIRSSNIPDCQYKAMQCSDWLRKGETIGQWMRTQDCYAPIVANLFLVIGNDSDINSTLDTAVSETNRQLEQTLSLVSKLLPPILMIIVGISIGALIFSVFSSLSELNAGLL